ncbi:MAG: alpha/beta fold hydrolase [Nocardioides sp.]|nr:alpha/beta fold hydrolase [Nocardioides sp.]
MGMPASYYGKLLAAMSAAGITTGLMEQRGHEAEGGRVAGWSYDFGYAGIVDDIEAAVARLTELAPDTKPVLLGHSLGGQTGAAYAAAHPDTLSGLVLVGAPSPYWPNYGRRFLAISVAMGLVGQVVGHFPGQQLRFAGREARTLMLEWSGLARTGRLRYAGKDAGPALAELTLPLLAISIEGDTLAPPKAVDEITRLMPRTALTRVHLDDEGIDHFKWARRPDGTIKALLDWLS